MNFGAATTGRSRWLWLLILATAAGNGLVWTAARGSSLPERQTLTVKSDDERLGTSGLANASNCAQCHQFEHTQSHPVNMYPSMSVDGSLPLQNGILTCLTCHDAAPSHGSGMDKVGIRGGDAATLCLQCHTPGTGSRSSHALAIGRAHSKADNSKSARLLGGLDFESQDCLSCHDGTVADGAVSHSVQLMDSEGSVEHPIGVPLVATERTRNGDFRMANASTLDRRIRLSEGNLSCTSCHSVYSKEPAKLVMSNQGSKLCLSCHTR